MHSISKKTVVSRTKPFRLIKVCCSLLFMSLVLGVAVCEGAQAKCRCGDGRCTACRANMDYGIYGDCWTCKNTRKCIHCYGTGFVTNPNSAPYAQEQAYESLGQNLAGLIICGIVLGVCVYHIRKKQQGQ